MTSSRQLENRVAVVTGGTRGIGRVISETLAREGARVVISSREEKTVARATREMTEAGLDVHGKACDVRVYDQVDSLMAFASEAAGGVDILVNNAGVGIFGHVSELSPEDWDQVIGTNLSGVFYCCLAALPHLRKRGGGYIFNISSLAGKNAFKGGVAYNASKFGLEGFSEALMLDLRYEDIKVSTILPGSVKTGFAGREAAASDWRLGPEDVAQVVLDLLGQPPRALVSRVELRPFKPRK